MKATKQQELMGLFIKAQTAFDANNVCMSVQECAEFLSVSQQTVLAHIRKNSIKATLIGRVWRIPKIQFLDNIIKTYNMEAETSQLLQTHSVL